MDEKEIAKALSAPFPIRQVKWLPAKTDGDRALAVAYIEARTVMQRLDAAVGPFNWSDQYRILQVGGDTVIECTLTLSVGNKSISRTDVGETTGSDFASAAKTGYSDALKRAGVKFGIGRYLYYLPKRWVGYNPRKKQLTEEPKLPAWAIPQEERKKAPGPPPKTEKKTESESTNQWVDDPAIEKTFREWTIEMGLSKKEVYQALEVLNLRDFEGSVGDAKVKIEKWVKAQTQAEDAQREQANRDLSQEEAEEIPF